MSARRLSITLSDPASGASDITFELQESSRFEGAWLGTVAGAEHMRAEAFTGETLGQIITGLAEKAILRDKVRERYTGREELLEAVAPDTTIAFELACPRCGDPVSVLGTMTLSPSAALSTLACLNCGNALWLRLAPLPGVGRGAEL